MENDTCEMCGCKCAMYVADPYLKEMYDEIKMVWLCDECYDNRRGDI